MVIDFVIDERVMEKDWDWDTRVTVPPEVIGYILLHA